MVSEQSGRETDRQTRGDVEGDHGRVSGAKEGRILVHERREGRKAAAESRGEQKAKTRVDAAGAAGKPGDKS